MNLLEPVKVEDFDALGRKHNGKEIIAALNIIKAANEEGLSVRGVADALNRLAGDYESPFGICPEV